MIYRSVQSKIIGIIFVAILTTEAMMPADSNIGVDYSKKITHIREFIEHLQQKKLFDGEIVIAQGEKTIIHMRSHDVEAVTSNGDQPQFLIGSVSKQFTAVALLKALYDTSPGNNEIEKCAYVKQQLHKPIIHFLPVHSEIWMGSMPTWAHTVTLHHLLTHTSGMGLPIRTLFQEKGFDAVRTFFSTPHTVCESVGMYTREPVEFAPGQNFSYSNGGYMVLTEVITALSGMPFVHYLQKTIFELLGMTHSCHPTQGKSYELKKLPSCAGLMPELTYNPDNTLKSPSEAMYDDISNVIGCGGIVSCTRDLLAWNRALHEQKTVLPLPLYDLLIQPNINNHGYGILALNGTVGYNGKIGNYDSFLAFIPSPENISIIVLSHVDYDEEAIMKESRRLDDKLKTTIIDDNERQQIIRTTINSNFPSTRGASLVLEFIAETLLSA